MLVLGIVLVAVSLVLLFISTVIGLAGESLEAIDSDPDRERPDGTEDKAVWSKKNLMQTASAFLFVSCVFVGMGGFLIGKAIS